MQLVSEILYQEIIFILYLDFFKVCCFFGWHRNTGAQLWP